LERAGVRLDADALSGATVMTTRIDIDGTGRPPTVVTSGPYSIEAAQPRPVGPDAAGSVGGPADATAWASVMGDASPAPSSPAVDGPSVPAPGIGGTAGALGLSASAGVPGGPSPANGDSASAGTPTANVDVTGAESSMLRATGRPGRAIIRGATDLGIAIEPGFLWRLRLDIIPEGLPGYPVEHLSLVPSTARFRVVSGVTLQVWIDRADPRRLAIDWSA
jgi:hypothetical protein